jgi:protein phosphatase
MRPPSKFKILKNGGLLDDAEEAARTYPNVMVRTLGAQEHIDIDVQYRHVKPGDLYLLCTDGLTRQMSDEEIRVIISDERMSLADRSQRLAATADARAGHDNVTVLLAHVPPEHPST